MQEPTITVQYSCKRCRTVERPVTVRARRGEAEDIRAWMNEVIRTVGADHAARSPYCRTKTLDDLKIPISDGQGIGEAFKH